MQAAAKNGKKSPNMLGIRKSGDPAFTVNASDQHAVAFRTAGNCGPFAQGDKTGALNTNTDPSQNIVLVPECAVPLNGDGKRRPGCQPDDAANLLPEIAATLLSGKNGTGGDRPPGSTVDNAESLIPEICDCLQERDSKGSDSNTKNGHLIPIAFRPGNLSRQAGADPSTETFPTLGAATLGAATLGAQAPCVAFTQNTRDEVRDINGDGGIAGALPSQPGAKQQTYIRQTMAVRRLTPTECERLQGFPDGWTKFALREKDGSVYEQADGPRYRQLGNAVAVPVVEWIATRIRMTNDEVGKCPIK